ncbi:uncharacterized protein LOC134213806 [Armigeres subalbatus]|uniref:uncharacterized protein LOC134213806 n=1 Tax=Armigeres subalbatus TaxID=124917 RepID=UPI002ED3AA94
MFDKIWLVLMVVNCLALAQTETSSKNTEESVENDVHIIRKTMEELASKPGIQFIEYGPNGSEGYKYHLKSGENKEYVIHTTGPITVPILETINGTREEKDMKLLTRLAASSKIKSMISIIRKDVH